MQMVKGLVLKLCSSTDCSRILEYVTTEDSRVDVGTIAGYFGLDPHTIKFNNIYVSRGHDFISCVTWGSLISCFSNKGLPLNHVVVQGKPKNITESWNLYNCDSRLQNIEENFAGKRRLFLEDPMQAHTIKKLKTAEHSTDFQKLSNANYKRCYEEDSDDLSRKRSNSFFGDTYPNVGDSATAQRNMHTLENCGNNIISLSCNSQLRKHSLNDEMMACYPCKKAR